MRILTVRQPWAWAIIHGGKDVENRVRNIAGDYRGPVAIHAGLRDDDDAYYDARVDAALDAHMVPSGQLVRGHITGVVDLVDVHLGSRRSEWCWHDRTGMQDRCSAWGEDDAYHLVLANPRAVVGEPIPWKGALGLRKTDMFVTEAGDWIGAHIKPGHASCTPYGCPPSCYSEPIARLEATR